MKSSLIHKLDRAEAMGWSRALPKWCGPCTWVRTPKKERKEIMVNLRRMRASSAWIPVAVVEEGA